ncbi:hypothetical protein C7212DRAFT_309150 [Tuber magnatum]|uniref:Uncharacterized protein n=1 Tax=Tuber magnatum TaxID=42249 RepID=A0A317SWE5_9PEZI|nr:hypothetical protein C7212DRAFT_309150 [Tuber magnatum]
MYPVMWVFVPFAVVIKATAHTRFRAPPPPYSYSTPRFDGSQYPGIYDGLQLTFTDIIYWKAA